MTDLPSSNSDIIIAKWSGIHIVVLMKCDVMCLHNTKFIPKILTGIQFNVDTLLSACTLLYCMAGFCSAYVNQTSCDLRGPYMWH